jgi:hypothetical protein
MDGGELRLRCDDCLQCANTRRVFLLSDEQRRRAVGVDGGLLHGHIERSVG